MSNYNIDNFIDKAVDNKLVIKDKYGKVKYSLDVTYDVYNHVKYNSVYIKFSASFEIELEFDDASSAIIALSEVEEKVKEIKNYL